MTRCPHLQARKPGHRYCPACHASYMREWRKKERAIIARLKLRADSVSRENGTARPDRTLTPADTGGSTI